MTADDAVDVVAVETNWILDVALQQPDGAEELLRQAEHGIVRILLPSICIAESIKRFDSIRQTWIELERSIERTAREITRSPHLRAAERRLESATEALTEISAIAEQEFWRALERMTRTVGLIEPLPETVALTANIRTFLNLQPSDASVLATVVTARRADRCRKFMSRDADFRAEDVVTYMGGESVEYFDSPYPIVGPLRRHMPSR